MNAFKTYIVSGAILALLAAGSTSCRKESTSSASGKPIGLAAGVDTRTMLYSDNLKQVENRLKIYDFVTEQSEAGERTTPFINDEIVCTQADGRPVWSYKGWTYFWTTSGSHRFMSWLSYDKALDMTAAQFFGSEPTLDATNKVLSIPAKTLSAASGQFDFIYSNEETRDMDVDLPDYSTVRMTYSHLFTAFSVGVRNYSTSPVTIKSFKLLNMPDTKSGVTLTFNSAANGGTVSNAGEIVGTCGNPGGAFFSKDDYNVTLNENDAIVDLMNPTLTQPNSYLMWPLAASEIHDPAPTVDDNGRVVASEGAPQVVITYIQGGSEITRKVPSPEMPWRAGYIYHFELQFQEKEMDLRFEALPWNLETLSLTYRKDAVQGAQVAYDSETCFLENDSWRATYNGTNIRGHFGITLPENSTWILSMTGDVGYFNLRFYENSTYFKEVYGAGTANPGVKTLMGPVRPDLEGGRIWFEIIPLTSMDRSIDRKIVLDFKVRTGSGQIVDAQSELNRGRYEIILPRQ